MRGSPMIGQFFLGLEQLAVMKDNIFCARLKELNAMPLPKPKA